MKAFVCVGLAILATLAIIIIGNDMGLPWCDGQPCLLTTGTPHEG